MTFVSANTAGNSVYPKPPANYAETEPVPAKNTGHETSETDNKMVSKQLLGSVKAPKASTIRKLRTAIEEWMQRFSQRPHRVTVDDVEKNIDKTIDIIHSAADFNSQKNSADNKSQKVNMNI